jgi:two-component system capsular synthesis response regulator RcsB
MTARIIVADDHPLVLFSIKLHLLDWVESLEIDCAATWGALEELASSGTYDAIITDYGMPATTSDTAHPELCALHRVTRDHPRVPVIVYTGTTNAGTLGDILSARVRSLVSKSDPIQELTTALAGSLAGETYISPTATRMLRRTTAASNHRSSISPREGEILMHIASGRKVGEIAQLLDRSPKTVSCQKVAAMHKLGVRSDFEIYELFRTR